MNKPKRKFKRLQLALTFAFVVFIIITITMTIMIALLFLVNHFNPTRWERGAMPILFLLSIVSIIVGTIISFLFSNIPLSPLREIISATDQLAEGDFSTRLHLKGPVEEFQNMNESFNHMAEELGSIEILRSDFVNNFSHEFKTPIVSMRGFAKILKYDDLTAEERNEYLDIIIYESERLSELATNVLNLSKIENQSILTDKTAFNISEQIRRVVALLENRWSKKQLDISFNCSEIYFEGNEELLQQVWINLLDNSIKFSPENAVITIDIETQPAYLAITFQDQGKGMDEVTLSHIFDKFYQGDSSHTTKGNGLGLTLSKKIVELHGGTIQVLPFNSCGTIFEVRLPSTNFH